VLAAFEARDFGIEHQLDIRRRLDAFDQVARHAGAEAPPRMIMVTLRAWPDRNTAACPAELPPPTRATSCSAQSRASVGDAQYQTPRPSNFVQVFDVPAAGNARRSPLRSNAPHSSSPSSASFEDASRRSQSSDLGADRDHDVGAEFLRLAEGAPASACPRCRSEKPR